MENASVSQEGKRPYHSRLRQRQAEETHARILAAARELLTSRGYANTTLQMIAEAAEVSPKTVSAVFGSKHGILAELVNPSAFEAPVQHLLDQLRTSEEPLQRVQLVVLITRQVYESLASQLELLRTAGVVAPELADLARQVELRRRYNQGHLIAYLKDQGMLLDGLSTEEATDRLWALTSYDFYRMLVIERRWSSERYETWLTDLLIQQLLQPVEGDAIELKKGLSHGSL
ncbi:MAG TPA: helix-turn-helix domain-containing protein [Ktedonobacteraceae bacterium]|nr:helix-turn-helix domain-containing protein [Ktedonobacteraceae bacterium]